MDEGGSGGALCIEVTGWLGSIPHPLLTEVILRGLDLFSPRGLYPQCVVKVRSSGFPWELVGHAAFEVLPECY